MGYSLKGNMITLTRGDTLILNVGITKDGEPYTPTENDAVRFALKRALMNQNKSAYADAEPLVLKTIPSDTMILRLESTDTKELPFGTYVYDIQITFEDGTVDTFIEPTKFTITPEVD